MCLSDLNSLTDDLYFCSVGHILLKTHFPMVEFPRRQLPITYSKELIHALNVFETIINHE